MSDLTNKDAEQDTKIALIDSTLDNSIRRQRQMCIRDRYNYEFGLRGVGR